MSKFRAFLVGATLLLAMAALPQVGLKEQALHLAAFLLLPALNLVEGEFEGAA